TGPASRSSGSATSKPAGHCGPHEHPGTGKPTPAGPPRLLASPDGHPAFAASDIPPKPGLQAARGNPYFSAVLALRRQGAAGWPPSRPPAGADPSAEPARQEPRLRHGREVAAAVVLGPVCDAEIPLGQFPWRFRERHDLAAENVDRGRGRRGIV